ncbi:MAG TPA: glutamate racemase, partial [Lachnospiraceae bacterium]|nr:glutamate racemase [Lachnospiraceae bacterium]
LDDSVTFEIARRYMEDLKNYDIDTLVLGCTHYPLIRETIQKVAGESVRLVNPAYETARSLKRMLAKYNIESLSTQTNHKFFVSDGAEKFKVFANTILPCEVVETKDINIEQY